jgi:TatD DNase family protein
MKLFDAHVHLQDSRILNRASEVIRRAQEAGIVWMMCCATREEDWDGVIELSRMHAGVLPSLGVHPWHVHQCKTGWQERLEAGICAHACGVGEIGLDYALDPQTRELQNAALVVQLRIARKYHRPVSIHCRKAWGPLTAILRQEGGLPDGGLVHAFGGSPDLVKVLEQLGAFLSFGAALTRPGNKKAKSAAAIVSPQRLLIETDSPDMIPYGLEADFNEPAHIGRVLETLAVIRGAEVRETAELTFSNSLRLFGNLINVQTGDP